MSMLKRSTDDRRRPYVRPMAGWWRHNPFFIRYMMREGTALVVAAYAFVLLAGVLSLAAGEEAYDRWLVMMEHPLSIMLHLAAFVAIAYHSWSWFDIMPKTMPPLYVKGKRVDGHTITFCGLVAAVAVTIIVFVLVWRMKP